MLKELRHCRCRRVVRRGIPALVVRDLDVETCTRRRLHSRGRCIAIAAPDQAVLPYPSDHD